MKIYTRTGDAGTTGLVGGLRVPKNCPRLAAVGAIDELNAQLGVCRATALPAAIDAAVERLQHEMFALGAELASTDPEKSGTTLIHPAIIVRLEREIDDFEKELTPLAQFILPGGATAAAALHLARGICRRAEREACSLAVAEPIRSLPIVYLNRVGDLLFVLARQANRAAGIDDVPWLKPASDPA